MTFNYNFQRIEHLSTPPTKAKTFKTIEHYILNMQLRTERSQYTFIYHMQLYETYFFPGGIDLFAKIILMFF